MRRAIALVPRRDGNSVCSSLKESFLARADTAEPSSAGVVTASKADSRSAAVALQRNAREFRRRVWCDCVTRLRNRDAPFAQFDVVTRRTHEDGSDSDSAAVASALMSTQRTGHPSRSSRRHRPLSLPPF